MYLVLRQIRVLVVAAAGLSGSLAMAADANHGSDLAKRGAPPFTWSIASRNRPVPTLPRLP
jgi:hypothetical protein